MAVRDRQDRQAFVKLFDHFAPRLKGMFIKSGLSAARAEDIIQDTMLNVWRKAHLFDPHRAQATSWIYRIARNRHIDVLRRENRPLPEELKIEDQPAEDASQIVALEMETEKLRSALMRLRPEQRELVEKAYLGELSHSDIQAETGLPLGTIKSRIRLGMERLRHEMKANTAS
ncbi:sigma-70 family RNA polymerase sigma factor [Shimia thalassica]|jgi:RNA polymerase sigma-70 factor (ECF subfamily)|nr:sigma-70 family RNA polymerase sigma factor [Shimia thalassica]MDO6502239.1 sigma-70 family RNA polymerase sigma factor [Shimia thalassica]MDO6520039.1 sigma-70 family RNA polymerase sigma factor [Shimia thalassica]MDP2492969.1 sigma-70 family RNA polymerase sigma factor [Shimia thalassica]MDP2518181.1 sigma-70 family RNA polymerase sigma factor [Shimia thalassica]MDP2578686.1 sigma-70 family RNA polymerase sigma factor [Shimia thalassica]